jgi:hypothetical protein
MQHDTADVIVAIDRRRCCAAERAGAQQFLSLLQGRLLDGRACP